ncbi:hypothetical protein [Mycolicibacterium grossiae]|uniref:Tetratricopeptide repeat family protein n=1 Tax=Mycolicibacterium grossiae TaxID=1552759 RepID=A0A1E8PWB4_9MYCO|nr:hypothetical protein [Mycolicibacterium grossiae]OFJ50605.1 hypothetical protein BEL07_27250 [Mycolicibacterium grossiae]QEM46617.1 hypothetical protein FZ046_19215 [Mycolicibacterium grossiae]
MSIAGDLERARHLALAADETAAKELLLALMPRIEDADRDDLMLEVLAQLGELYLVRTAYDGVREAVHRIGECLTVYQTILDGTATADVQMRNTMSESDIRRMTLRYRRRAHYLRIGLAAAVGDHEGAADRLAELDATTPSRSDGDAELDADLDGEFAYLRTYGRILCAIALVDDDLHVRSEPLWRTVIDAIEGPGAGPAIDAAATDNLFVIGAIGYARFCIETGRIEEAEPWLRRAGARAEARDWRLPVARTKLERATACWARGDHVATEGLLGEAYPVIAEYARAHDVSRCWLYFGLTRMGAGMLQAADESWGHAERHWRELGKPLHIHRILLQRSWISVVRGRFGDAVDLVEQARACLDESPRSSWVAYARLDAHLGAVWRADALADLAFDGTAAPGDDWAAVEARYRAARGVVRAAPGSADHASAMRKLATAVDLVVPAALAVDSVRYAIADAAARARWAAGIAAPLLARAFAVAAESEDTRLVSELIEYHCARGTFSTAAPADDAAGSWTRTATAPAPASDVEVLAQVASGPPVAAGPSLTRLGPLPPLAMDPTGDTVLSPHRFQALRRYGQHVTTDEPAWATWP